MIWEEKDATVHCHPLTHVTLGTGVAGEAVRPGDAGARGARGLRLEAQGEAGAGDARAHGVHGARASSRCAGAAARAAGQWRTRPRATARVAGG